jgi:hypothetical protein
MKPNTWTVQRSLFVLLLCSAPAVVRAQSYDVAVFGDMPYVRDAASRAFYLPRYHALLEAVGQAPVEFAVHVGDFTTGPFCGDSTVNLRYQEFQNFGRPLVFLFGDNDWTDCARGGFDPLERLEKLRQVFTRGNESLGRSRIALQRQSDHAQYAKFRENVRWTHGRELYVALNVPGSSNNWGRSAQPSAEYHERNEANLAFLRESFALAARDSSRGVVIFIQANPGLNSLPEERGPAMTRGFEAFLSELQAQTMVFRKPVVLFHGDTHYFRIDKPFMDGRGHVVANFTRVETFGHPNYYWVKLHVDPTDPELFSFRLVSTGPR